MFYFPIAQCLTSSFTVHSLFIALRFHFSVMNSNNHVILDSNAVSSRLRQCNVLKMIPWIVTCLSLCTIAGASSLDPQSIASIYDELKELNIACGDLDRCQGNRHTEDLRVVNCQCGDVCSQLGTCCLDSKHKNIPTGNAKKVYGQPMKPYGNHDVVFMVNKCKPHRYGDDGIRGLCEITEHDGYRDPFILLPVTNPRTGITYSNYYCFACNEERSSDSPVLWDFKLFSNEVFPVESFPNVTWDHGSFMANNYFVHIGASPPTEISSLVNWYRPNVISRCAEGWTDLATKAKCEAYTAMVYFKTYNPSPVYMNPHCAICNNVDVSELVCAEPEGNEKWGGPPYGFLFVGLISMEDKVSRCPRNQVFDKFSNKCRPFRCGRNQKLVDGKCVNN